MALEKSTFQILPILTKSISIESQPKKVVVVVVFVVVIIVGHKNLTLLLFSLF